MSITPDTIINGILTNDKKICDIANLDITIKIKHALELSERLEPQINNVHAMFYVARMYMDGTLRENSTKGADFIFKALLNNATNKEVLEYIKIRDPCNVTRDYLFLVELSKLCLVSENAEIVYAVANILLPFGSKVHYHGYDDLESTTTYYLQVSNPKFKEIGRDLMRHAAKLGQGSALWYFTVVEGMDMEVLILADYIYKALIKNNRDKFYDDLLKKLFLIKKMPLNELYVMYADANTKATKYAEENEILKNQIKYMPGSSEFEKAKESFTKKAEQSI